MSIIQWSISPQGIINLAGFAAQAFLIFCYAKPLPKRSEKTFRMLGYACLLGIAWLYITPLSVSIYDMPEDAYSFVTQSIRAIVMWVCVFGFLQLVCEQQHYKANIYRAGFFVVMYLASINTRVILISILGRNDLILLLQAAAIGAEALILYLVSYFVDIQEIETTDITCWPVLALSVFLELYFKWALISIIELPEKALKRGNWTFFAFCATYGVLLMLVQFERNRQIQKQKLKAELERVSLSYEMQNAKRALQTNNDMRRLYHDMKNHLLAIQNMTGNTEELHNYLDELLPQFCGYETNVFTGNAVVDALLSEKTQRALLDDIAFNICLDLSGLEYIRSIDLVTIFGNAVDNAIEAVQMMPKHDDVIIYLKSARFANFVVLKFSNPFVGNIVIRNGMLATGKSKPEMHGIGLSSIQKAAQRYGGTSKPSFDNSAGWFTLCVMLPIQQDKKHGSSE